MWVYLMMVVYIILFLASILAYKLISLRYVTAGYHGQFMIMDGGGDMIMNWWSCGSKLKTQFCMNEFQLFPQSLYSHSISFQKGMI